MANEINAYFAILQLNIAKKDEYTLQDIKRAFKKQAMKWHPDRNSHQLERSTERMKNINEAHAYLIKEKTNEKLKQEKKEKEKEENISKPPTVTKNVKPKSTVPKPTEPAKPTTTIPRQKQKSASTATAQNAKVQILLQQKEKEKRKQIEKDNGLDQDCILWKKKSANRRLGITLGESEMDFLITAKIIFVDLFRGKMEVVFKGSHYINSKVREQIAQIWYHLPLSKGNCKFVHLFCAENYINQYIHSAADCDFYSREKIIQYLQQRAYHYLNMSTTKQPLNGLNQKELTIIFDLLRNWNVIWD